MVEHRSGTRRERFSEVLKDVHLTQRWFVFTFVTVAILVIFVLCYTHLPSYIENYPVEWWYVAAAFLVIPLQFVGYALALRSSATTPLKFGPILALEVGESVTSMATPESVGSLALSMRFLKRAGLDTPAAAAAVGLSSFVTTIVAMVVLPIAVVLAASTINYKALKQDVPSGMWELIIGIIAVAVAVTVLIKAPTVRQKVKKSLDSAGHYLKEVAHRPARASLIGLAELITLLGEAGALWLLVLAVNQHANIPAVLVIVMVASTASSVVPIPGGLGAPEAILLAGLASLGVEHKAALIAAVSFRLLSYWLPPLPGMFSLRWLVRSGRL